MILRHTFALETQMLVEKARMPGISYSFFPAVEEYMTTNRVYYADIRYAMKHCEVLAMERHIVPGLKRYVAAGADTDQRMLHMVAIIGGYDVIEIERLLVA